MDLAIGVIIGAAFQGIVTSFTESFINPIINSIGGAKVGGHFQIFHTGQYIEYGAFLTAVINFIIMAFVIFLLMKGINKLMAIGKNRRQKQRRLQENVHIVMEKLTSRLQSVCIVPRMYRLSKKQNHNCINRNKRKMHQPGWCIFLLICVFKGVSACNFFQ